MTQPPNVPGPYDPQQGWEPTEPPVMPPPVPQPPAYYPPQPVPVYYPQPPTAPAFNPGRAAGNTVVVVLTLVFLFCVLPVLVCAVLGALGQTTTPSP